MGRLCRRDMNWESFAIISYLIPSFQPNSNPSTSASITDRRLQFNCVLWRINLCPPADSPNLHINNWAIFELRARCSSRGERCTNISSFQFLCPLKRHYFRKGEECMQIERNILISQAQSNSERFDSETAFKCIIIDWTLQWKEPKLSMLQ